MKKRIKLISALLILCITPVFCSSCFLFEEKEVKVSTRHSSVVFDFNNLWAMEFPEEFSPVFIYYQRGGWMGEGAFSAIYECEQPNEEFLKDFSEDMNEEVKKQMSDFNYYYENREQLEEKYDITITLESGHLPDWDQKFISVSYHSSGSPGNAIYKGEEYWWGHDKHLYMSYFPENKMLYIYEDIS